MAYKPKPWVDSVWLAWFILQLIVIALVDGVQFYPKSWYAAEGSPLHALQRLHDYYLDTYDDPIVRWDEPGRPWTRLFAYVEMLLQLPVSIYGVYLLGWWRGRRGGDGNRGPGWVSGVSGTDELLFLIYALETAFTTLVCMYDVAYWDAHSFSQKYVFWFQLYGPWFLMPSLMSLDMYLRLRSRLKAAEGEKKTQ